MGRGTILSLPVAALALAYASGVFDHPDTHKSTMPGYNIALYHSNFRGNPVFTLDIEATSPNQPFDRIHAFAVPGVNIHTVNASYADAIFARVRATGDDCGIRNVGIGNGSGDLADRACTPEETKQLEGLVQRALQTVGDEHHPETSYR